MMICKSFSCSLSDKCINYVIDCEDFQCCPKIIVAGLCAVCSSNKVCHIEREREKD